jgi:GNAT superfamily N-acetyltransferase
MSIQLRSYTASDYMCIDKFLITMHLPGNRDGNWLQPAWEYMHYHPAMEKPVLEKIGIWEDDEEIIAVVHPEWRLGEAFFQFHPSYHFLQEEMLNYAESNLAGISNENGNKYLCVYINDYDSQFRALAEKRGYQVDPENTRPMYRFDIPQSFPGVTLPAGYTLKSLADECDWGKVNRVLWRGFNHPGEPPCDADELESRRTMFDTPTARRDLKIVVVAPNGDFVAFCGMFYEVEDRFAYVEPVATDPDYRRLGLGKAAVLEGIRRCAKLGATVAYVGSDQAFYQAIGFKKVHNSECWTKTFP